MIIIKGAVALLTFAGTIFGAIGGIKGIKKCTDKYKVVKKDDLEDLEKAADNAGLTDEDIMLDE